MSLDIIVVQGKHLWPLHPAFPCPLSSGPCPAAQRNRDPARALCPLKDKSKWEVLAGKGIQAEEQCAEPQEAVSRSGLGAEARQATQRTHLGRRVGGGWGCWRPAGALPQPGSSVQLPAQSRTTGHPGGSEVAAKFSGGDVSMAPEPGSASSWVLCGAGTGEAKAEGTSQRGRRLSQRACSPPPFPRTGLASLG